MTAVDSRKSAAKYGRLNRGEGGTFKVKPDENSTDLEIQGQLHDLKEVINEDFDDS